MKLKISVLVSVCFLGIACCWPYCVYAKKNTPEKKPNIIYILADDLGYGELGCYGQKYIETPNIDQLARDGIRFTDHYAGAPVCAPSRCTLLTGMHTGHASIRGNDIWKERGDTGNYLAMLADSTLEGQRPMPAETITIGKLLKTVGYTTGMVGKWGLGAPNTKSTPGKQGFDYFYGYNCQRQAHTYYPLHLYENEHRVYLDNDTVAPNTKLKSTADPYAEVSYSDYTLNVYAPDTLYNEMIRFIEHADGHPFFMYWATPLPHTPLQAPKKWIDYYVDKFGDEEPYRGNKGYFPARYPRATYAAMISCLDERIGQLIAKLKELNQYDNTIIIFTSDNGPTYTGGADNNFFNSGGPFKSDYGRGKGFLYEGGIRVPMIASWPDKIKGGSISNHISAFWDVLPTLCDVTGVKSPKGIDGISFLPELHGQTNQKKHKYFYWEFPANKGQQAVRMDNWKAIRRDIFKGNMAIELYDLSIDLRELDNVADKHPDIVKQIEKIMLEAHSPSQISKFKMKQLGDK